LQSHWLFIPTTSVRAWCDSEHVPRHAPEKPEWASLTARSSGLVPFTAATGLTAASKWFQKCINGAHFTSEHY